MKLWMLFASALLTVSFVSSPAQAGGKDLRSVALAQLNSVSPYSPNVTVRYRTKKKTPKVSEEGKNTFSPSTSKAKRLKRK